MVGDSVIDIITTPDEDVLDSVVYLEPKAGKRSKSILLESMTC